MALSNGRAAIAICDRCNFKFPYQELRADGNSHGLRVCEDCWDPYNPWRLTPIKIDNITLKFPRPDTDIALGPPSWDSGLFWDEAENWDQTEAPPP